MGGDLENLEDKIETARANQEEPRPRETDSAEKRGKQIATEIILMPVVSGAMGYGLDHLFGTLPLMLILMIFLGFAAGMYRAYKLSK